MLVLSRKIGERIHIGNNIIVTVTKVSGNRVTIGIDAPQEVGILRGELNADSQLGAPNSMMLREFSTSV